jgi:hypothetical protein
MVSNVVSYADGFRDRLNLFEKTLQELFNKHWIDNKNAGKPPKVVSEFGTKWVKIIQETSFDNRCVHSFIDPAGNIYKAAGWQAPAKHVRGSIFDENCGVGTAVNYYGARSLRN